MSNCNIHFPIQNGTNPRTVAGGSSDIRGRGRCWGDLSGLVCARFLTDLRPSATSRESCPKRRTRRPWGGCGSFFFCARVCFSSKLEWQPAIAGAPLRPMHIICCHRMMEGFVNLDLGISAVCVEDCGCGWVVDGQLPRARGKQTNGATPRVAPKNGIHWK